MYLARSTSGEVRTRVPSVFVVYFSRGTLRDLALLSEKGVGVPGKEKKLWVKTNGIPSWGRCTTHFRTYFSGDWDVH